MESVIKDNIEVIMNLKAREWCKLPYPNHPKGCPNYGTRNSCPPRAPMFTDVVKPPFKLVGVRFNLEEWAKRMKEKHPNWSDKQTRCCLYWQGKVRKVLRELCKKIVKDDEIAFDCPEAMGVQVFNTCFKAGIKLVRNPRRYVWKITIIGKYKIIQFRCDTCCKLLTIRYGEEIICPICGSVFNYYTANDAIVLHNLRYACDF